MSILCYIAAAIIGEITTVALIERKITNDNIKIYKIAKKSRNYIDAYITAGICASTFLYNKDEKNYIKWKNIEEEEKENLRYKNLI